MFKTCTAYSLSKPSSFTSFRTVCGICPIGILDGVRCLFDSGSSLCFVVILASGVVVDDAVADDVGVAAGFGIYLIVTLDLGLPWGA